MLYYLPIKTKNGTVVGSLRAENGEAAAQWKEPCEAVYLLADGKAVQIRPMERVRADKVDALIGVENGMLRFKAVLPHCTATETELLRRVPKPSRAAKVENPSKYAAKSREGKDDGNPCTEQVRLHSDGTMTATETELLRRVLKPPRAAKVENPSKYAAKSREGKDDGNPCTEQVRLHSDGTMTATAEDRQTAMYTVISEKVRKEAEADRQTAMPNAERKNASFATGAHPNGECETCEDRGIGLCDGTEHHRLEQAPHSGEPCVTESYGANMSQEKATHLVTRETEIHERRQSEQGRSSTETDGAKISQATGVGQVRIEETASDTASFMRLQAIAAACYQRLETSVAPTHRMYGDCVDNLVHKWDRPVIREKRMTGSTPIPPTARALQWAQEAERMMHGAVQKGNGGGVIDQDRAAPRDSGGTVRERDGAAGNESECFSRAFPKATWKRIRLKNGIMAWEGLWNHDGERIRIHAVRSPYTARPPKQLVGFTRYLKTCNGGYWLRLTPYREADR